MRNSNKNMIRKKKEKTHHLCTLQRHSKHMDTTTHSAFGTALGEREKELERDDKHFTPWKRR